ncbi:MAG: hypothetical protein J6K32_00505 [Clostridia bacterium]|nr:hypothetical protein [Clostridia bacterium]
MNISQNEKDEHPAFAGCSFAYAEVRTQCTGMVRIFAPSCGFWAARQIEFYLLFFNFFTVENPKTGSAIKSIIPKILTAISGSSNPITLAPASINAETPIISKLIDHMAFTFFESIFLPPQIQVYRFYSITAVRRTASQPRPAVPLFAR